MQQMVLWINIFYKDTFSHKGIQHNGPARQLGRAVNQTITQHSHSTGSDGQPLGQPATVAAIKDI